MDIDQEFVNFNKEVIKGSKYESRMTPLLGSIFDTKLASSSFDFVIARFVFQHIYNINVTNPIQQATIELKRVLKPGGKLVIVDSDQSYQDLVFPHCEACGKIGEKQFNYRIKLAKSPPSYEHSGTEIWDYLIQGGYDDVKHESVFASSRHFSDGINKFLPMLIPDGGKQLVSLGLISERLYQKAMNEYRENYIDKIHGEPHMSIVVFMGCGTKTVNGKDEL